MKGERANPMHHASQLALARLESCVVGLQGAACPLRQVSTLWQKSFRHSLIADVQVSKLLACSVEKVNQLIIVWLAFASEDA